MKRFVNLEWGIVVVVLIALIAASVDFAWGHGVHVDSEVRKGSSQGRGSDQWMGPHKGEVRGVGDYHLEFLVKGDKKDGKKVVVYLYDMDMKPLSAEDKEGVLYFRFPGNVKRTLKLDPFVEKEKALGSGSDSHFEAEIDLEKANSFKAVVSLKIGKKRHNLRFSYSEEAQGRGKQK